MFIPAIIAIIVVCSVMFVILLRQDIKSGIYKRNLSPEDKIIGEMRMQRVIDYFNNPVVKELEKHRYKD